MLKAIIGSQNKFEDLDVEVHTNFTIRDEFERLLKKQPESSVIIFYIDTDVDIKTIKRLLLTGDNIKV